MNGEADIAYADRFKEFERSTPAGSELAFEHRFEPQLSAMTTRRSRAIVLALPLGIHDFVDAYACGNRLTFESVVS